MAVPMEDVRRLRETTQAGISNCKQALEASDGNFDAAVEYLRKKGLAGVASRAGRIAKEGLVTSYVHGIGKIGVLVEVNCESDFVAKTDEFQALAKSLAMQVAAARPRYTSRAEVPPRVIEKERSIYREQVTGKPAPVIDKIVDGKLEKFYQEVCLLDQPFIKDDAQSIQQVVAATAAKVGENIVVRRFCRFELGEEIRPASHGNE